jgi:glucosyl-3-phosphoglycerate phosphatase
VWWPLVEEPAASVTGRAATFRAEMAALPAWTDTLVVSHWGFILTMTGQSVMNGQWLRCDPTDTPPQQIIWRA